MRHAVTFAAAAFLAALFGCAEEDPPVICTDRWAAELEPFAPCDSKPSAVHWCPPDFTCWNGFCTPTCDPDNPEDPACLVAGEGVSADCNWAYGACVYACGGDFTWPSEVTTEHAVCVGEELQGSGYVRVYLNDICGYP